MRLSKVLKFSSTERKEANQIGAQVKFVSTSFNFVVTSAEESIIKSLSFILLDGNSGKVTLGTFFFFFLFTCEGHGLVCAF